MDSGNGNKTEGASILIVEDSPTQAMLLKHLLERHGYQVTAAASGKEALEFLSSRRPALIISDIVMPEMDGYELTQAIKLNEELVDIPVILLTTLVDPEDIIKGLEAKVDFYLNKPIDEEFLLSKVESVLANPTTNRNMAAMREIEVTVGGKPRVVKLSAENSLNLLVSTYENAIQINKRLLRAQTDLRGLNRDLEKKVRERTAHLEAEIVQRKGAEEKVKLRTGELEAANTELREFAYVVSHDLKAPLRAVSQLAGWIASDHSEHMDQDGKEMITLLLGRLDRMHNLIEGILQYSRIGRVREEADEVDLDRLLHDIIDLLAPPEHIRIEVLRPLPVVFYEPTRAGQVLQNLISNAMKYMDKPQGEIRIDCENSGSFWQISVADNGPGIDSKYFEKIFMIFQTLQARDDFESTGIGLTLVKRIVEMHGGKIWLESELGKGTTFFFTIPRPTPTGEEASE
ncbi:MAG: response regulator [Desulfomonile tiedjei]|nr:response regulator [Desulfomonile tiedjei]